MSIEQFTCRHLCIRKDCSPDSLVMQCFGIPSTISSTPQRQVIKHVGLCGHEDCTSPYWRQALTCGLCSAMLYSRNSFSTGPCSSIQKHTLLVAYFPTPSVLMCFCLFMLLCCVYCPAQWSGIEQSARYYWSTMHTLPLKKELKQWNTLSSDKGRCFSWTWIARETFAYYVKFANYVMGSQGDLDILGCVSHVRLNTPRSLKFF